MCTQMSLCCFWTWGEIKISVSLLDPESGSLKRITCCVNTVPGPRRTDYHGTFSLVEETDDKLRNQKDKGGIDPEGDGDQRTYWVSEGRVPGQRHGSEGSQPRMVQAEWGAQHWMDMLLRP